ncbi:thiamine-phosphate kinase [Aliidiomarina sedimenti]|uniref:Thiamine-monophosphate kinase n=1 Tax=Aliidiomarina sedimenti TaxID=1933879 RepID=A0ABY0BVC7_9GAMM|nr:thiamine-phosphate kinase [Aliidiomarina sedimenti]RUO28072.1 thiamine-phosphate kinase [Aliidiomarina sedimenti]
MSVLSEFELIERYFRHHGQSRRDVQLAQGDDCAVVKTTPGTEIAVTTDTMVAGVHFDDKVPPRALGHKLVAVNLSDLAAMGAEPAWLSLAITLPKADHTWLSEFAAGMHELAGYYHCQLIGGDTTRGPLTLTLTAQGLLPEGQTLVRHGAKPGDWIFVSGTLGDAAAALAAQRDDLELSSAGQKKLEERLFYPTPRVSLGQALRGMATSCIDVSDGLAADLQHILKRSEVGGRLFLTQLPYSDTLNTLPLEQKRHYALHGGDDYELCFTIPEEMRGSLETALTHSGVDITCIGQIDRQPGLRFFDGDNEVTASGLGYQHFGMATL